MMWSTIANLKENLNKIALDVHDDDDELQIYSPTVNGGDHYPSVSNGRISHRFAHSNSKSPSPVANGIDSAYNSEIEQYKAEIKRLQDSEGEIKALSVNYAALLKEKEDRISRLNDENGSLKQNLNLIKNSSGNGSSKSPTNSPNILKGSGDQSLNGQHKPANQIKTRSPVNLIRNGVVAKQEGVSNGFAHDVANFPDQNGRSIAVVHHELEMQKLRTELERERDKFAKVQLNFQEAQKLNESFQVELNSLKQDKEKTLLEMNNLHSELNEKMSEIRQLQVELNRRNFENSDETLKSLNRTIATIEKDNTNLKMENNRLEDALRMKGTISAGKFSTDLSDSTHKHPNDLIEKTDLPGSFRGKEEMELSLQKLEKDLQETRRERDKASQELSRLKQHLLEKESEESEKMDEDSKVIEELQENNEFQKAQILHMEKALKQAIVIQEQIRMEKDNELHKFKVVIDDLNRKLGSLMSSMDAKHVELLNLQTALGQYYAEIEAKERVEQDLALAREESAKLSGLLKESDQKAMILKEEKEEIFSKLLHAEKMLAEGKNRVNKVEEENTKLRRALEQSMTRLNRMSMDSDYFVDRRIVIKLLVTYFERNHSKEVLDLMVRMLGFSEEDKQRIGVAQQGVGKGVVRGVLGLPGRLVGGIMGGSSSELHANATSDNQSFADLWVDFLIKETEEREKREPKDDAHGKSSDATKSQSSVVDHRPNTVGSNGLSAAYTPASHSTTTPLSRGNSFPYGHSDSEFSTVPLTSSESNPQISRLYPRY